LCDGAARERLPCGVLVIDGLVFIDEFFILKFCCRGRERLNQAHEQRSSMTCKHHILKAVAISGCRITSRQKTVRHAKNNQPDSTRLMTSRII
jgi:hypothetical protein